eukprot:2459363-Heterocapsa_arctica.AAC.2
MPGMLRAPPAGSRGRPAWRPVAPWLACPPDPAARWCGRCREVGTYAGGRGSALGKRQEGQPC